MQAHVSLVFSAVSIALSEVARALQGLDDDEREAA
jgi:hypothetical protein